MKLSKFKFNLPKEQIALYPAKNRDESRMLVVNRKTGTFEHHVFKDISEVRAQFVRQKFLVDNVFRVGVIPKRQRDEQTGVA